MKGLLSKPSVAPERHAGAEPAGRTAAPILRRQSLHAQAAERLRRLIMRGEIVAGEKINEIAIAKALGISRTPLREAVKLLASEGLLELRPGRGAHVRRFSPTEIRDHFEVIGALERHAAEIAARRITAREAVELRALHESMQASFRERRQRAYFQANQKMHALVVSLAGNAVLSAVHRDLVNKARHDRPSTLSSPARWAESMREHDGWVEAIRAGDGPLAGALILAHARRTGEAILGRAAQDWPDDGPDA